jgi:hypothetical protein
MSSIAFNSGINFQTSDSAKSAVKPQVTENIAKAGTLSEDQVSLSVKKGILPTFKGASAGLAAGAIGAGAVSAIALKAAGGADGWGGLVVLLAAAAGAGGGAVIGGATANFTDNKLIGTAAGAVVGAAAMGLYTKNISGAIVGAVGGGLAGLVGASVAKKE